MGTKLQLAADTLEPEALLHMLGELQNYVDILELGTPYLLQYGAGIIEDIRNAGGRMEILCDSKIVDAGFYEAAELFKRGADYVTVLALADRSTIKESICAGREYGKKVMADMICVKDTAEKVQELEELGIDIIAVHTGVDRQKEGRTPLEDLAELRRYVRNAEIAVAGGITKDTAAAYLAYAPEIIIVGGGVFRSEDPIREAEALYAAVHGNYKSETA